MNAFRWSLVLAALSIVLGSIGSVRSLWTQRPRRLVWAYAASVLLFVCCLPGCAEFPREQGTRRLETTWLALDAVDTAQTMQIAKHPECYSERDPLARAMYGTDHPTPQRVLVTNVLLGLLHPVVSRWLDDGYENADDDTVALWAIGRGGWHAFSLLGTGTAVLGNFSIGLTPTSANCRRAPR